MTHVHLIGIGGSGISAIARLLLEREYVVTGSDRTLSPLAQKLARDGVKVFVGHKADQIQNADLIVRSSAIPDDNVEVRAARERGIPVLKRADYLGQLMADQVGIAVAGTHGKTTTSAMIAWMLTSLNQDPTFIVGGVLNNLETNARSGSGSTFVIEADEYDHMFLGLRPSYSIITNVEHEHPDLFPTPAVYRQAFERFVDRLTQDGTLLACTDDPGAAGLLSYAVEKGHKTVSYGLEGAPDYHAKGLRPATGGGTVFDFVRGEDLFVKVLLPIPGRHNVQNALAAMAMIDLLGHSVREASQAMQVFRGTGRRFQIRGQEAGITVIDDYAHHPTEIQATLRAARENYPDSRIWAVWQPHTFLRTKEFFDAFTKAFGDADRVLVTEIYSARERGPAEFTGTRIAGALDHPHTIFAPGFDEAVAEMATQLTDGDVVLILSAGDANKIGPRLLDRLRKNGHAGKANEPDPGPEGLEA